MLLQLHETQVHLSLTSMTCTGARLWLIPSFVTQKELVTTSFGKINAFCFVEGFVEGFVVGKLHQASEATQWQRVPR